jgi:primary-amine oxidase
LKPLEIVQSEGPSFEILGNEVRWQRWRLRVSLHPTEGLVLHTVSHEDGGRLRSILYRASLSDMVVPYGDPSSGQFYKNAFDAG